MMQIIRNITVIIIVGLLIVATGGFSIYHHLCNCKGERSASVFMETTCDPQNSSPAASCCSDQEIPSCCKEKQSQETKHQCNGNDCCNTSIQFLKINDVFQPGLEKISLKPVIAASSILFIDVKEDVLSTPIDNICFSDLPPPDSGRQIVLSLHQLKLDPSLV